MPDFFPILNILYCIVLPLLLNIILYKAHICFRLTHLPYASSKLLEHKKTIESGNDVNISVGQSSQEIHLYVRAIDEELIEDQVTYSFLNCFPSIFISKAVHHFFSLKTNSKVKLDVCSGSSDKKLSEINFTVLKLKVSDTYYRKINYYDRRLTYWDLNFEFQLLVASSVITTSE